MPSVRRREDGAGVTIIGTALILIVVFLVVGGVLALANIAAKKMGMDAGLINGMNITVVVVTIVLVIFWLWQSYGGVPSLLNPRIH